jgi:DNA-directed RNA polymerase subunit N (RpoN/RPB10)
MFTTPFICYSCGNPNVAHAVDRFANITNGWSTEEERFALMGKSDEYPKYANLMRIHGDSHKVFELMGRTKADLARFEGYVDALVDASLVYPILGIYRLCCMRSVMCTPVWPNYNPEKPPVSSISTDAGTRKRFIKRDGNRYDKVQIYMDQYGNPIIPEIATIKGEQPKRKIAVINFTLASEQQLLDLTV